MDPLLAKIIFVFGYVVANFVIRTPYIKAHHPKNILQKIGPLFPKL